MGVRGLLRIGLACAALGLALPAAASAFGPIWQTGSSGPGEGQFAQPGDAAVGPSGRIYIADSGNNRVDVYSPGHTFVFAFGKGVKPGGGDTCTTSCQAGVADGTSGSISDPKDLSIDYHGRVFVADNAHNRIDVFRANGAFVRAIGKGVNPGGGDVCTTNCLAGSASAVSGALNEPTGISVTPAGLLFVADDLNHRIAVFRTGGAFVRAFGQDVNPGGGNICTTSCQSGGGHAGSGSMHFPVDTAVTSNGLVAVSDYGDFRVDVFRTSGTFVRAFGKNVNPAGGDVCTTSCQFGTQGAEAGELSQPNAIALDPKGNLYVSGQGNYRIDQFSLAGRFIRAFGQDVIPGGGSGFEVCTTATTCKAGSQSDTLGSLNYSFGVAVDCRGSVYSVTHGGFIPGNPGIGLTKFGARGVGKPPCHLRVGKPKLNRSKGTAKLKVTAPGPGTVVVSGRGLKRVKRSVAKLNAKLTLPLKATGSKLARLKRNGKVEVKAQITYTPLTGRAEYPSRTPRVVGFRLRGV